MANRWRKQLKFNTLTNYHDLVSDNENEENEDKKTISELEEESRASTLKNLQEVSVYFDDMRRDDWLSMYINAISETFDPHTYYFAPQVKDRFDAEMSGKYLAKTLKNFWVIRVTNRLWSKLAMLAW